MARQRSISTSPSRDVTPRFARGTISASPACFGGCPHRSPRGCRPDARDRERESTAVDAPAPLALEAPSLRISRRRALVLVAAGGALVASLVLVLPSFADLPATMERLTHGDARWLVLALG